MKLIDEWSLIRTYFQNPSDLRGRDLRLNAARLGASLSALPIIGFLLWQLWKTEIGHLPLAALLMVLIAWYAIGQRLIMRPVLESSFEVALVLGLVTAVIVAELMGYGYFTSPYHLGAGQVIWGLLIVAFATLGLSIARAFKGEYLLGLVMLPCLSILFSGMATYQLAVDWGVGDESVSITFGWLVSVIFGTGISVICVIITYGLSSDLSRIIRGPIKRRKPWADKPIPPQPIPPSPHFLDPRAAVQRPKTVIPVLVVVGLMVTMLFLLYSIRKDNDQSEI